ncbi:MAG: Maf family nucleotide pyrophosphatase [Pseudomonadota bacterium]|nr:Maf family nucleotide pyrophosphatase [Pseudomonadota bacterium]
MKLLLASGSPYRRELLQRLRIPFAFRSPDIDETPHPDETAQDYVVRLAAEKAAALRPEYPDYWIIGSDQTSVLNGRICGKPGNAENAVNQLLAASGQTVSFLTGLCLQAPYGQQWTLCEPFSVHFRELTAAQVSRYVELEQPLDCAGSFKVEGLGITLFERLEGRDINSLVGLPLIGLTDLMMAAGMPPLQYAQ